MKIVVASRGRPNRQITAGNLREAGIEFDYVLTERDETRGEYPMASGRTVVVDCDNYSQKCQRILEMYGVGGEYADEDGKFLKLDDDLHFRRTDDNAQGPDIWRDVVSMYEKLLELYPLVGISERFMINNKRRPYELNTRTRSAIGWNTRLLGDRSEWPTYDRLSSLQDVDVQFQIITRGMDVAVITDYYMVEKSWADGGCNIYRTREMSDENHRKLQALWPEYISLRDGGVGGGLKTVLQFKRAARDAKSRR